MKKVIALILTLAMIAALCACGHEHAWSDWKTTKEASCTEDGMKERTCECGETETEVIPAAGHSFGEWEITAEASCDTDGQQQRTCSVCGETETEVITAEGHKFSAATCFAPKTCSVCGATEGEALGTALAVGEIVETENASFVLSGAYFASEIKEKHGNTTYTFGNDGAYYLVLELAFTNLSTEALDRWDSDRFAEMKLSYADKYDYEGEYRVLADDIVPLAEGKVFLLYSIPESMKDDTASSIITTFELDGKLYGYIFQEGAEAPAEEAEDAQTPAAEGSLDETLSVGETRTDGENFSFVLNSVYFTEKLSEKHGNTTYSLGGDGDFYLVLELDYSNLSAQTLEDYNDDTFKDMKAVYNDKFEYEGDMQIFIDGIVPLASGKVYVYFSVAPAVQEGTEPLTATFSLFGHSFTVDCRAA